MSLKQEPFEIVEVQQRWSVSEYGCKSFLSKRGNGLAVRLVLDLSAMTYHITNTGWASAVWWEWLCASRHPILVHWVSGQVLTKILKYVAFLRWISSLKIHLNLLKLVLYFSHYLISSFKFTAYEIITNLQHQFRKIKMDFKTRI